MIVYLSVMLLCCILLYALRNDSKKYRPLSISFGMVWLMIALQDGWGGDYVSYVNAFDWLKGQSISSILVDDSHGEIGYKIFMSLMPSHHVVLMVGMGIWCFTLAFFFYHFVPQRWWFFAILFVFFDRAILMGMIASYPRMAIASSFLVYAIYFTLNKDRLLAVGLVLAGSLFHTSVLFMLPLLLLRGVKNHFSTPTVIAFFVVLTLFSLLSPSSWINMVERVLSSVDTLGAYSHYIEGNENPEAKRLVLIILFYWIYILTKTTKLNGLKNAEYMVMYYALIRIGFDMLPAFGLSTRFFYYIDTYFFAGMMCVMNSLPKNDLNKYGIAISLLLMFWYIGFHAYSMTPFFMERWGFYNFIL